MIIAFSTPFYIRISSFELSLSRHTQSLVLPFVGAAMVEYERTSRWLKVDTVKHESGEKEVFWGRFRYVLSSWKTLKEHAWDYCIKEYA